MGNILNICLSNDLECNSECFEICKISGEINHHEGQHHDIIIGDVIKYKD
jgi:hypothetical protein